MFKINSSQFFSILTVFGVATLTAGAPAQFLEARGAEVSPNVQVCSGALNGPGCVTIPISSEDCVHFTGGLSFLDKEVSNASIQAGLVCTFYEDFGCLSSQGGHDTVVLQGGNWDFFAVPGPSSTVDFNDLTSSFICSPV